MMRCDDKERPVDVVFPSMVMAAVKDPKHIPNTTKSRFRILGAIDCRMFLDGLCLVIAIVSGIRCTMDAVLGVAFLFIGLETFSSNSNLPILDVD